MFKNPAGFLRDRESRQKLDLFESGLEIENIIKESLTSFMIPGETERKYKNLIPVGRVNPKYNLAKYHDEVSITLKKSKLWEIDPEFCKKYFEIVNKQFFWNVPTKLMVEKAEMRLDETRPLPQSDDIKKISLSYVDRILSAPLTHKMSTHQEVLDDTDLDKKSGVPMIWLGYDTRGDFYSSSEFQTESCRKCDKDFVKYITQFGMFTRNVGKVEWSPIDDFKNNKARTFNNPGGNALYAQKRCFMQGNENLKNYMWSAYGFNPFMGGVARLVKEMLAVDDFGKLKYPIRFCWDVSGYDRLVDLTNVARRRLKYFKLANKNIDHCKLATWVAKGLVISYMVMTNGDIVIRTRGNNSGSGCTTTNNIEAGFEILSDVLCAAYYEKYNDVPDFDELYEQVVRLYGDDNIASVSDDYEMILNKDWLEKRLFEYHSLVLKEFQGGREYPIENMTFLGFRFYESETYGWLPRWDLSRLLLPILCTNENNFDVEKFIQRLFSIGIAIWPHHEVWEEYQIMYAKVLTYFSNDKIPGAGNPQMKAFIRNGLLTDRELMLFYSGKEGGGPMMNNVMWNSSDQKFNLTLVPPVYEDTEDDLRRCRIQTYGYENAPCYGTGENDSEAFNNALGSVSDLLNTLWLPSSETDQMIELVRKEVENTSETKKIDYKKIVFMLWIAFNKSKSRGRSPPPTTKGNKIVKDKPVIHGARDDYGNRNGFANTADNSGIKLEALQYVLEHETCPELWIENMQVIEMIRPGELTRFFKIFDKYRSDKTEYEGLRVGSDSRLWVLPFIYTQYFRILEISKKITREEEEGRSYEYIMVFSSYVDKILISGFDTYILQTVDAMKEYHTSRFGRYVSKRPMKKISCDAVTEHFIRTIESISYYHEMAMKATNSRDITPIVRYGCYNDYGNENIFIRMIKHIWRKFGFYNDYGNENIITKSQFLENRKKQGMSKKQALAAWKDYQTNGPKKNKAGPVGYSRNPARRNNPVRPAVVRVPEAAVEKKMMKQALEAGANKKMNNKNKSGNYPINLGSPGAMNVLTDCSMKYLESLCNPFWILDGHPGKSQAWLRKYGQDNGLPCIPLYPASQSRKLCIITRFNFSGSSSTGGATLGMAPLRLANDYSTSFNAAATFFASGTSYGGNGSVFPTQDSWAASVAPDTGINMINCTSEFTQADLAITGDARTMNGTKYRLVAAGLRFRYIGTVMNRSGEYHAIQMPAHETVSGLSTAYLSNVNSYFTGEVTDKWTTLTYAPVVPEEMEYKFDGIANQTAGNNATNSNIVAPLSMMNHFMGFTIFGGASSAPYQAQAVQYFEVMGPNIVGKTKSDVDMNGLSIVSNTVSPATQPALNKNGNAVEKVAQMMPQSVTEMGNGLIETGVKHLVNTGKELLASTIKSGLTEAALFAL